MFKGYYWIGKGFHTIYPFSCNTTLKVSQMSGSSSTITIDLEDDDDGEQQLVN